MPTTTPTTSRLRPSRSEHAAVVTTPSSLPVHGPPPSPRSHHRAGSKDQASMVHKPHRKKVKPVQQASTNKAYSVGQVVIFVSIGTSIMAVLTVLIAVHAFTNSLQAHIETMNTTWIAVSPLTTGSRNLRSERNIATQNAATASEDSAAGVSVDTAPEDAGTVGTDDFDNSSAVTSDGTVAVPSLPDNPNPKLVWLMSFPNSGTSFTIHMTREATNCTTATNYGLEGEIRNVPSVPAIQGPTGIHGPWLELLPHRVTRIADTILVKTHCKGFCSGSFCGADKTFHTTRSFLMGCLTGNQGIAKNGAMRLVDKTYDKSLVKKAIHIFRSPLDNVVARFHLEYNEKSLAGDSRYTSMLTKDVTGFRRWCALDDRNRGLVQSRYIDPRLRGLLLQIPCFNEFYRYTQWHNLAFETTRAMNLTTMILHYHEYAQNFAAARGRILEFLELPQVGDGIVFDDGKEYGHYYSRLEKVAIANFLQEFASTETWEQLKEYDFQTDQTQVNSM